MTENLVELINNIYVGKKNPVPQDFVIEYLVSGNGFMVFSKNEIYNNKEISNFKPEYLFSKYPYKHRYFASYKINENNNKTLVYVLYNPSYANPDIEDATITNCIELATKNDSKNPTHPVFGTVEIINLFSLRNPTPSIKSLKDTNTINREFIINYLTQLNNIESKDVVFAWGHGKESDSYCKNLTDEIKTILKNKTCFIIGVDIETVNKINHHPDKRVWNGMGGFKNVAKLVPINN